MIYCPECGTVNEVQNTNCHKCGTVLPQLTATARPARQSIVAPASSKISTLYKPPAPIPLRSRWQTLSPAMRAAMIMAFFTIGLQSINTSIPGLGFVVTVPFQIASYFVQGILVGKFASSDIRYTKDDYLRLGGISALWTVAILLVIGLLLGLALTTITIGGIVIALPFILISQFGTIFLATCFTVLGPGFTKRLAARISSAFLLVSLLSAPSPCVGC